VRERLQRVWEGSFSAAWVLMILAFPITSLPLLIRLVGSNMVAAPSAVILLWLLALWFVPYVIKGGSLPRQTLPFLAFLLAALLSSAAAYFIDIPPFRDSSILSREVQALFTLAIGVSFYLVVSTWPQAESRLRLTLKALNWAGVPIIVYTLVQTYFWYAHRNFSYPEALYRFQAIFSPSGLYAGRANAFAFEPSWLAHQLNVSFLPFWLAATVRRTSAHRFRPLGISFENLLLVGGAAALVLSFSRVGLLGFLATIAYLLLRVDVYLARRLQIWVLRRFSLRKSIAGLVRVGATAAFSLIFLVVFLAGSLGLVYELRNYDPRLVGIFQMPKAGTSVFQYANQLVVAERLVFWDAGWRIFNDHPLLGVGIGNAGFFFPEKLPPYSWGLVEVNDLLYHQNVLPNTKSLWVRLLSETGILGFSLFLVWAYVLWRSARFLESGREGLMGTLGLAGQLVLIVIIFEGFSVDTFALPYIWFSLGVVTGACALAQRQVRQGRMSGQGGGAPPAENTPTPLEEAASS
jgi:O-antigen ligase